MLTRPPSAHAPVATAVFALAMYASAKTVSVANRLLEGRKK
jgi:hypothetical protein